jgi:protein-L-isoaspartate O-methyltransferase
MRFLNVWIFTVLVVGLVLPSYGQLYPYSRKKVHAKSLAPYVPSPQPIVERMLELAEVEPGETVYDLGSGDGRILITAASKYKAKAVGVELDENLVKAAEDNIKREGLAENAKVIHGNMLEVDVSPANVVIIYLLTLSNDKLRPVLEKQLKPGTRVVSHNFKVPGWSPAREETVISRGRSHHIYVYEIPKR